MAKDQNPYAKRRFPPGHLYDYPPDVPRRRVEDYYQRYVPRHLLHLMGAENITEIEIGDYTEQKLTILFTDIRNFTTISEQMSPRKNFEFINRFLESVVPVILNHNGIIDKFIGDAVMALFPGKADQALAAAISMIDAVGEMETPGIDHIPLELGIGLNTGFVMLGAVGNVDRMEITVIGDSVNLAARLQASTKQYNIPLLIGESTLNALENPEDFHIRFIDRMMVKGKKRPQSIYEVYDNDPAILQQAKSDSVGIFENALAHYHLKNVNHAVLLCTECLERAPQDTVSRFYLDRCHKFLDGWPHEGTGELDKEVAWSNSYMIDIPLIDQQHMELLANTNKLSALVREEKHEGMSDILNFLEEYAITHFKTEEELMTEFRYPFLNEHIKEHNRFIEYFTFLRQEIESKQHDKLYLMLKIDVFLVDWLLNHTTGTDKHFGTFLLEKGYLPEKAGISTA